MLFFTVKKVAVVGRPGRPDFVSVVSLTVRRGCPRLIVLQQPPLISLNNFRCEYSCSFFRFELTL